MVIQIHPYGTPHHLIHDKEAIFLEPGTLTYIGLEQKNTHFLHNPNYQPHCDEPEYKIIKDYPYSKSMCEVDCLMQLQLKECGCVADEFDRHIKEDITVCTLKEMQCIYSVSDNPCRNCPASCHIKEFKIKTKSRLDVGDILLASAMKALRSRNYRYSNHERVGRKERLGGNNIVALRVGLTTLDVKVSTESTKNTCSLFIFFYIHYRA